MGTLIAKKYPTVLFAKAADHTYVECGTGRKAWGCWGGKTGGDACVQGTGSTLRADKIAQPNEKANIACYLINGVCHQAANRILSAANISLEGAGVRGYGLSTAIFGIYGRAGVWPCKSPFMQYNDVNGDLPECIDTPHLAGLKIKSPSDKERKYTESVLKAYNRFSVRAGITAVGLREISSFQIELFDMQIEFRLGKDLGRGILGLRNAKSDFEKSHESLMGDLKEENQLTAEFIKEFNLLTEKFQDTVANSVNGDQYQALFNAGIDERLFLADPDIIKNLYGQDVMNQIFNLRSGPSATP